jgi:hypothetical protein
MTHCADWDLTGFQDFWSIKKRRMRKCKTIIFMTIIFLFDLHSLQSSSRLRGMMITTLVLSFFNELSLFQVQWFKQSGIQAVGRRNNIELFTEDLICSFITAAWRMVHRVSQKELWLVEKFNTFRCQTTVEEEERKYNGRRKVQCSAVI